MPTKQKCLSKGKNVAKMTKIQCILFKNKKERKKESIFNVHEAKNSLWDRLFFHLAFVFGPFPVKFYNNRSQLLNKLFAE
jgi:hypothetical protein